MLTQEIISIVIPTYNYDRFISETIESVLNQTYQYWECIVIDNGSTDSTESIVAKYLQLDSRFKYKRITHTTTSSARNAGIEISNGKYLLFLDSDDQIGDSKLANAAKIFHESRDCDIVYSDTEYYKDGYPNDRKPSYGEDISHLLKNYNGNTSSYIRKIISTNLFVISSPIIKSEVVKRIGKFNDKLNWVEDWEFYIRVFLAKVEVRFDDSKNSTSRIRIHNTSLSTRRVKMLEQSLLIRKNLPQKIRMETSGEEMENLLQQNQIEIQFLRKLIFNLLKDENKLKALKHLSNYCIYAKDYKLLFKANLTTIISGNLNTIKLD